MFYGGISTRILSRSIHVCRPLWFAVATERVTSLTPCHPSAVWTDFNARQETLLQTPTRQSQPSYPYTQANPARPTLSNQACAAE